MSKRQEADVSETDPRQTGRDYTGDDADDLREFIVEALSAFVGANGTRVGEHAARELLDAHDEHVRSARPDRLDQLRAAVRADSSEAPA
jgi:hypothetical protein